MTSFYLLATEIEIGSYINLIKVGTVLVLLIGWAAAAQWVDRDTDVVKTKREQWNMIVIAGAMVGFVALLIPPWIGGLFYAGVVCWLLITGGALVAYVLHRNGRVMPEARVLTIAFFKRLVLGDPNKKKEFSAKGLRVRLADHDGKLQSPPTGAAEAQVFDEVQDLLYELCWRRASDVDMIPGKERFRLIYRIDGVATERPDGVPLESGERIIRYLKGIAGLNIEEIRRPQTGHIQAALLSHEGEIEFTEVRTSGTTAGERLRLKIQSGPMLRRLHELGLASARLEILRKDILAKPTGLFLLCSPRQHGLTTTQYAVVRSHDAYMHNIHALERRPFTELDNITQQMYEGANTDVNYARMLQSIIRREPDIVLVGECEDRETAQIATRAAAEDRKIYLGMEAKNTGDALGRYLTFVEDNKLAAKALRGVLCQRLVRVLCEQCREPFKPDSATLKKLNLPADKIERFYRPPTEPKVDKKGREIVCPSCQGTGYVGRTAVFELLVVDEAVAQLIAAGAPVNKIKAQCRKKRMYYLQEEALLKVIEGTTSMNEILRCLRSNEK